MDQREMDQFVDDPEEFVKINEDCCDKQNLGEVKTEAARFLEKICDRSRNYSQYVIQFCLLALETHINKVTNIQISNTTSLLPLETALLILSINSYNLSSF
jgi:hypothetical protein